MKFLVIGAGNMGRRHGKILESFGDTIEYHDVGFDPSRFSFKGFDGALICTPPETHETIIRQMASIGLPIFVEKPVVIGMSDLTYPGLSMVACNWRWCKCLRGDRIDIRYPAKYANNWYDLIHFIDLYWERCGRPHGPHLESFQGTYLMALYWPDQPCKTVHFDTNAERPETYVDDVRIHERQCDMFEKQMEAWRYVVQGTMDSPNPIEKAVERTNFLVEMERSCSEVV